VLKNLDLKSLAQIEKFWVPISLKNVIVVLEWLLLLINQILIICIKPHTQLDAVIWVSCGWTSRELMSGFTLVAHSLRSRLYR
jgi:hypothetical protein